MTEKDGMMRWKASEKEWICAKSSRSLFLRHKRIVWIAEIGFLCFCLTWFSALCIKFWPYTMDDSYITFRYAQNFAKGHGLVFNIGEFPRAEGVTSPLYALLLALFAPSTSLPAVAKLLGLLSVPVSAFLIGLAVWIITARWTGWSSVACAGMACVSAGYYLCNAYAVGNAADGMETAFSCLAVAVFWTVFLHVCVQDGPGSWPEVCGLGMAGVVVALFRPEMALMSAMALVAGACVGGGSFRRKVLMALLVFLCVGAGYFCVRAIYFRSIFPLPFYIKQGRQGSLGLFGWSELEDFVISNGVLVWLSVVGAIMALAKARAETESNGLGRFVAIMAIVSWLQVAYYGTIRHIMGFGLRYFQPTYVGLTISAFAGLSLLLKMLHNPHIRSKISITGTVVLGLVVLWTGNINAYWQTEDELISGYAGIGRPHNPASWDAVRDVSRGYNLKVAMNDCGIFPYYTGFQIVDLAGLNQREIAQHFTRETTLDVLRRESPDLVILCSNDKNNIFDLKQYEAIDSYDVLALGYQHEGSIFHSDTYHWLVFSNHHPEVKEYLEKLNTIGFFEWASNSKQAVQQEQYIRTFPASGTIHLGRG